MPGVLLAISAALVGLVASWLLSLQHLSLGGFSLGGVTFCANTAASGCSSVLSSKYASILGIPLAYAGVLYHSVALAACLAALRGNSAARRTALVWALAGAVASAVFVALQFLVIHASCPLCLTSAAACLLQLLGLSLTSARSFRPSRALAAFLTALLLVGLPLGALASLHVSSARRAGDTVLARFEDRDIRLSDMARDLPDVIEGLERATYEARLAYVRRKLGGLALEAEGRKVGLTGKQYIAREVDDYINRQELPRIEATASEMSPGDNIRREKIIQTMLAEARDARLEAVVDQALQHYRTATLLAPPAGRVVELDPTFATPAHRDGPADAPLQLVVFSDLQCPLCAEMDQTLGKLRMKFGDKLAVTFRHFPLASHDQAENAAVLSEAVADALGPNGFQLFKRGVFARVRDGESLTPELLTREAQSAGLEPAKATDALGDQDLIARVRKSADEARKLRFDGSPVLILNTRVLGNLQDEPSLENRLNTELQKSG